MCSPANSLKFQPCGRTPQAARLTLAPLACENILKFILFTSSRLRSDTARPRKSCNIKRASFTAWTTGVSNPNRSPRFRPSPSDSFSTDAFATGGPRRIKGLLSEKRIFNSSSVFNPYTPNTSVVSRSQALQYLQHARQLAAAFHQRLTKPATGALGPIIVMTIRGSGITAAACARANKFFC